MDLAVALAVVTFVTGMLCAVQGIVTVLSGRPLLRVGNLKKIVGGTPSRLIGVVFLIFTASAWLLALGFLDLHQGTSPHTLTTIELAVVSVGFALSYGLQRVALRLSRRTRGKGQPA